MKRKDKDHKRDDWPDWLKDTKQKPDGFRVPVNYFEEFGDRLDRRIESQPQKGNLNGSGRIIALQSVKWMAIAATLALLVYAGWTTSREVAPTTPELAMENISSEDATQYILNNIDAYHWEDFVVPELAVETDGPSQGFLDEVPIDELIESLDEEELNNLL